MAPRVRPQLRLPEQLREAVQPGDPLHVPLAVAQAVLERLPVAERPMVPVRLVWQLALAVAVALALRVPVGCMEALAVKVNVPMTLSVAMGVRVPEAEAEAEYSTRPVIVDEVLGDTEAERVHIGRRLGKARTVEVAVGEALGTAVVVTVQVRVGLASSEAKADRVGDAVCVGGGTERDADAD